MITIACLPIAGIGNPYQHLMMEGLRSESDFRVIHGIKGKFFALFLTAWTLRPDYIHIDWLHSYYLRRTEWMTWILFPLFVVQVWVVRHIFGIKLVWTLHNIWPHDMPKYGPYKWARRYFARNCTWIRVFDEGTIDRAAEVLGVSPNKFRVVPEGDYTSFYPNTISSAEARVQLGLGDKEKVLLYLGLIKPYKGVLELMTLFNQIPETEDTRLVIAGKAMDNRYLEALRKQLNSRILFHEGFVDTNQLQVYYNAADVVVLPFKAIENSGSAILAMGFGKAIVAPKKGVLVQRLSQQNTLLYAANRLEDGITNILSYNIEQLNNIGKINSEALKRHQWPDFIQCFR